VRELEGARDALEKIRQQLESSVAAAKAKAEADATSAAERIGALEAEIRRRDQAQQDLQKQSDKALREREKTAEKTLREQQSLAEQVAREQRVEAERALAEFKARSEQSLKEARAQAQAREQELTTALNTAQQRLATLEAAHRELESSSAAERTQATTDAATAHSRIEALSSESRTQAEELATLRSQLQAQEREFKAALAAAQQRYAELDTAHRELENSSLAAQTHAETAAASARSRIDALTSETLAQAQELATLRSQLQAQEQQLRAELAAAQQRNLEIETARQELEAAAGAAREQAEADAVRASERIAALEQEGRSQAEQIRELKVEMGAVRDSLAQRNALIERVEAEAASSVAMLGNIQHNLEHLGAEEQPHLLTRMDGGTGIVHLLGRRTTFGRTPDNDVHIDAEFISRHHAVALRAGGKTVIEDLNSTNGTYVNGQRISRHSLKDGDLVTLGKTEFRFSVKTPTP
jgi:hypothetical protein